MLYDGTGFWFIEDPTVFYKTVNKDGYDYKVNLNVFPLVVRLEGEGHRDIKAHVNAVDSYRKHRDYVSKKPKAQQESAGYQSDELICQEDISEVGLFKAFGNGVVVVRF